MTNRDIEMAKEGFENVQYWISHKMYGTAYKTCNDYIKNLDNWQAEHKKIANSTANRTSKLSDLIKTFIH